MGNTTALIERLYRSHAKKHAWNAIAVRLVGVTSSLKRGCEDRGRQAQSVLAEREQAKLRQGLFTPFRRINGRSKPGGALAIILACCKHAIAVCVFPIVDRPGGPCAVPHGAIASVRICWGEPGSLPCDVRGGQSIQTIGLMLSVLTQELDVWAIYRRS